MSVTIYSIRCLTNNKIYIGQTTNITSRFKNHKSELKRHMHCNKYLQNDYDKYGLSNFEFCEIEECEDDVALTRETYYMNLYGGTNSEFLYNVKGNCNDDNIEYAKSKVAHLNGNYDLFSNHKHSQQSKEKISKSLKSAYRSGNHKLSGCVCDNRGSNNSFYGKHHSEEVKQKLSKLKTKYDENFVNTLRSLRSNGMKVKDIAKSYNMNKNVVGSLIKYGTSSGSKIKKIKIQSEV